MNIARIGKLRGTLLQSEFDTVQMARLKKSILLKGDKKMICSDKKYKRNVHIASVTIHTYVGELIQNEDGYYDNMGSAWLSVPIAWAEERIKEQGYDTLEDFLNEYTYDESTGWLDKAIEDRVLLGVGFGQEPEYVAIEDINSNEIEVISLESAKEKYISLRNAGLTNSSTSEENTNNTIEIMTMDSKELGRKLEDYGYAIR